MSNETRTISVDFDEYDSYKEETNKKQIKELTRKIKLAKREHDILLQRDNDNKDRISSSKFRKIIETLTNEKMKNGNLLGFLEASKDQYSTLEAYHKALETEVEILNRRFLDMSLTNIELANQLKNLQEEQQSMQFLKNENEKLNELIETASETKDKARRGTSRSITQGLRRNTRSKQRSVPNQPDKSNLNIKNMERKLVKTPLNVSMDIPNDKSQATKNSSKLNTRNTLNTSSKSPGVIGTQNHQQQDLNDTIPNDKRQTTKNNSKLNARKTNNILSKSSGNNTFGTQNDQQQGTLIKSSENVTMAAENDRPNRIHGKDGLTLQKKNKTEFKTLENQENKQPGTLKNSKTLESDNKKRQRHKESIENDTNLYKYESGRKNSGARSKLHKQVPDVRDKEVEKTKPTHQEKHNKPKTRNTGSHEDKHIQNGDGKGTKISVINKDLIDNNKQSEHITMSKETNGRSGLHSNKSPLVANAQHLDKKGVQTKDEPKVYIMRKPKSKRTEEIGPKQDGQLHK